MRRFPVAFLVSLTGCVVATVLMWKDEPSDVFVSTSFKILQTLMILLPLIIALRARELTQQLSGTNKMVGIVLALLIGACYYLFTPLLENANELKIVTRWVGLVGSAHLMASFSPFWRGGNDLEFWEYNKTLFVHIWQGLFYIVAAGIGIMLAYLALDKLFALSIASEVYGTTWVWLLGMGFTLYFLFHFPTSEDFQISSIEMDKMLDVFIRFIMVPLVILYFLILYAYSAKILVEFTWPEGWISKLILGFSTLGMLGYLLAFPKLKSSRQVGGAQASRTMLYFGRYFFWVLFPLTVVLLLALQRRIHEYGLTEFRYFALVLAIWLSLVTGYMLLSRRRSIVAIPMSLTLGCLLCILGPLNAYKVSSANQWSRLTSVLDKYEMMDGGMIASVPEAYDEGHAKMLSTAVDYFYASDRENRLHGLLDSTQIDSPDDRLAVNEFLNLRDQIGDSDRWRGLNWDERESLALEGYDFVRPFQIETEKDAAGHMAWVEGDSLIFHHPAGQELASISLASIRTLVDESPRPREFGEVRLEQASLEHAAGEHDLRVVFRHISVNDQTGEVSGHGLIFFTE